MLFLHAQTVCQIRLLFGIDVAYDYGRATRHAAHDGRGLCLAVDKLGLMITVYDLD